MDFHGSHKYAKPVVLTTGGRARKVRRRNRPKTARSKNTLDPKQAEKFYVSDQYKHVNLMFSGSRIQPQCRPKSPVKAMGMGLTTTTTQCNISRSSEKPSFNLYKTMSGSGMQHYTAQNKNLRANFDPKSGSRVEKSGLKRPVTATYKRVENDDEGSVKHQLRFSFKFDDHAEPSLDCTGSQIKPEESKEQENAPCTSESMFQATGAFGKSMDPYHKAHPYDILNGESLCTAPNLKTKESNEQSSKPAAVKNTGYAEKEQISPKSMPYYKKIRRPQSALLVKGREQKPFGTHMRELTGSKTVKKKPKGRQSEKKLTQANPDVILSNRSAAMNLRQLFSEKFLVQNQNYLPSKTKSSQNSAKKKCNHLTPQQLQSLVDNKLSELDEFMRVENRKRWFRPNSAQLTSSLIRSQINMIRNTLHWTSQGDA